MPREQVRPGWRKAAATAPGRVLALARRVPAALLPPALGGLPFLRNGDQPGQATLAAPAPTLPAATLLGQAPPSAPRLGPGAPASSHPASRRWPFRYGWVDAAWVAFSVANLVAMMFFPQWETVPFHFIWISFTILYGFRVWAARPTLWVLGIVILATGAAISWDVWRQFQPLDELTEVPLMAAMFLAMVWHARRRLLADEERSRVSAENARLLATQRRFLQDASHQLRTPITIALGHAELLAAELGNRGRAARDIDVVVGELTRLRHLGERLLMIAAAEDPEFLRLEPVALDRFTMDVLRKWMPTAARTWRLGRLDAVTVEADRERLGLAVDALLENAVRHTRADGIIQLSVLPGDGGGTGRMIIADSGTGIPAAELAHIFDRFRSGAGPGDARRTGLGLALVRAVAQAHGGEALVRSTPGQGSEFELVLPVTAAGGGGGTVPPAAGSAPSPPGTTTLESSWRGRTS